MSRRNLYADAICSDQFMICLTRLCYEQNIFTIGAHDALDNWNIQVAQCLQLCLQLERSVLLTIEMIICSMFKNKSLRRSEHGCFCATNIFQWNWIDFPMLWVIPALIGALLLQYNQRNWIGYLAITDAIAWIQIEWLNIDRRCNLDYDSTQVSYRCDAAQQWNHWLSMQWEINTINWRVHCSRFISVMSKLFLLVSAISAIRMHVNLASSIRWSNWGYWLAWPPQYKSMHVKFRLSCYENLWQHLARLPQHNKFILDVAQVVALSLNFMLNAMSWCMRSVWYLLSSIHICIHHEFSLMESHVWFEYHFTSIMRGTDMNMICLSQTQGIYKFIL